MTRRRPRLRLLLSAAGLLLAAGAIAALVVWLNTHGTINPANYDKIRPGMARAGVEAILDGPGHELPPLGYEDIDADETALGLYPPPHELRSWASETHQINVLFDFRGSVAGKSYSRDPGVGVIRRVIDWLGL